MNNLIEEIENSLMNKNYLSALALTLTLPDICGKIAFPEIEYVGERYVRWYNEYIYKYEIPSTDTPENTLVPDGKIIYKLRCNLLHDGSLDVEEVIRKEKGIGDSTKLKFILTNNFTSYNKMWENGDKSKTSILIRIGVEDFCRKICAVVKNLYCDREKSQNIFNDVIILNFD